MTHDEGIELPNQEKIQLLGEKEIYKYWGILETGSIKEVEMKDKILKKNISGERGNSSNQNNRAEISSKRYTPGLFPFLYPWDHSWSGRRWKLNKWTKEQENSWRCIKPFIPDMIKTDYTCPLTKWAECSRMIWENLNWAKKRMP